MKIQNKAILLTILTIGVLSTIAPSAFAAEVIVENAPGASVPGCEETNECFLPYEVSINVGDTVTWVNDDTAAHTATGGSASDGPSGVFDSSLVLAGSSFSFTFNEAGTYEYFCMVHPWMAGVVIVGEAMAEEGGIMISIEAEPAAAGETTDVTVTITNMDGSATEHVNYDVMATQGSDVILDEKGVHDHDGVMTHTTMALPLDASSEMPVDVTVTFNGFGIDPPFTGPIGESNTMQVVPEFGTIAMMILGVSIVSIIALSAKSRVTLKL
ncbi:MAG: PEFG-CTERM sorting domain-containing protein [Thaumarchaeota archaeon]|nr:PEFG-CTERM sorting domain-containing protein [Nitrososphaerota archaeon]